MNVQMKDNMRQYTIKVKVKDNRVQDVPLTSATTRSSGGTDTLEACPLVSFCVCIPVFLSKHVNFHQAHKFVHSQHPVLALNAAIFSV